MIIRNISSEFLEENTSITVSEHNMRYMYIRTLIKFSLVFRR